MLFQTSEYTSLLNEGQSKEEKQKQSCAAYLAQEARKLKSHDDITVLICYCQIEF